MRLAHLCHSWAILGAAITLFASGASANPCVDYRQYLHTTARLATPGDASGIVAASGRAYVADGGTGLLVVDVTDPDSPAILGQVDTPGSATGVALAGNLVFVADGASGLQVIDVSIPATPQIVGSADTPGTASDVVVAGNLAFVADGGATQIVDVSSPAAPTVIKTIPRILGNVKDVGVSGNLLYTLELYGLRIYDVSAPLSPVLLGSISDPQLYQCGKMAVAGGRAYLSGGDLSVSMTVVDVSDPTAPALVSTVPPGYSSGDIAVAGDHVFVGGSPNSIAPPIRVFDISNPASPIQVGIVPTSSQGLFPGSDGHRGLALLGDRLFAAGGDLAVVDIDPPLSPLPARVDTPGNATDVATAGTHAYVADGTSLQVVDLSAPFAPTIVGSVAVEARTVAADGDLAFVGGANSRSVIDISDPTSPVVVGTLPGGALDVELIGTRAYVANGYLDVVDVSDPAHPIVLGSSTTAAQQVEVEGSYAYTGTYSEPLLRILDISGDTPVLVGTANGSWTCFGGLVLVGDTVECGDPTHSYVTVYDVADPAQPYWETYFRDQPMDMAAQTIVYTLHEDGDVFALLNDVAVGLSLPPAVGTFLPWPLEQPWTLNMEVAGGLLLVAAGSNGLAVFPALCETPTAVGPEPRRGVQLALAGPNPAWASSTLHFTLSQPGTVRLTVYDAAGRRVRDLDDRWYPAGDHIATWDGLDDHGRPAANGVYFVQLVTPAGSARVRVSRLR